MLVSPHGGGINEMDFPIHVALPIQGRLQLGKHFVPGACPAPTLKATVDRGPFAIAFWDISPGCTRSQDPEHAIQELPMILCWTSALRFPSREQRLDPLPLFIA